MTKPFDRLVTGDQYLRECERARQGEITIEQIIAVRDGYHQWRIIGRELPPEERRPAKKPSNSVFTQKQSVFKI